MSKSSMEKTSLKAALGSRFISQWLSGLVVIQLFVGLVSNYYEPSNIEFISSIKSLRVDIFITLGVGMLTLLTFRKGDTLSVACAALFSITLALSSGVMQLIPADVRIPEDFFGQTLIFLPLTSMLSSLICMSLNLIWAVFKAV
ncbi:hypothetical protein ACUN8C_01695 [Kushneria sp. Sum13]|uniref:hypothetical protein n=1 Tax=Kushneria sp. Sum13 TaxID=3459196 RepID=UPI004045CE20